MVSIEKSLITFCLPYATTIAVSTMAPCIFFFLEKGTWNLPETLINFLSNC